MTIQQLENFARTVTAFCDWAEAQPSTANEDANTALIFVSQLYAQALCLPKLFNEDHALTISYEDWSAIYQRFCSLPFNYYDVLTQPTDVANSVPSTNDLADDLADIWRDLKCGLALYNKGNCSAAAYEWKDSFDAHWGRHAAGALYALHCWQS